MNWNPCYDYSEPTGTVCDGVAVSTELSSTCPVLQLYITWTGVPWTVCLYSRIIMTYICTLNYSNYQKLLSAALI